MSSRYAPLPVTGSSSSVELRPDRFLLEAHCSQPLLAQGPVHEITPEPRTSLSNISALELARLINDPGEVINASFPRLSGVLADAQLSITEKRIDDLYSQLQQVSEVLQELITELIPNTEGEIKEESTTPVAVSEPEIFPVDAPVEVATQADTDKKPEPLRAMAMAA